MGISGKVVVITGASRESGFDALRVEDGDAMIDVNLRGALYGVVADLPVFQRQKRDHFINIVRQRDHIAAATIKVMIGGGMRFSRFCT